MNDSVSIRSPPKGGDAAGRRCATYQSFNPLPLEGERLQRAWMSTPQRFQSTLPSKERLASLAIAGEAIVSITLPSEKGGIGLSPQIHAPLRNGRRRANRGRVSIPLPSEKATTDKQDTPFRFQSTLPSERRPIFLAIQRFPFQSAPSERRLDWPMTA